MTRFAGRVASLENKVETYVLGLFFFFPHVFWLGVDFVYNNFAAALFSSPITLKMDTVVIKGMHSGDSSNLYAGICNAWSPSATDLREMSASRGLGKYPLFSIWSRRLQKSI